MDLKNTVAVTNDERLVLEHLAEAYSPDEWGAYAFASLSRLTKLDVKAVRRACRSLTRKGLAAYERSLWNDDGLAGAGYRATEEGAALVNPCDLCGKRAIHDYHIDEQGKMVWLPSEKDRHIRECEDHFEAQRQQQLIV